MAITKRNTRENTAAPKKAPAAPAAAPVTPAAHKKAPAKAITKDEIASILNAGSFTMDYSNGWKNKVVGNTGRQSLHWGALGAALLKHGFTMFDKENTLVDFTDDINSSVQTEKDEQGNEKTQWSVWLPKELAAYDRLLTSGKPTTAREGKHTTSVIAVFIKEGFKFAVK